MLKRTATTYSEAASEWDDGATSAYTSRQSQEDFAGIVVDYCFTNFQQGNKPRGFKSSNATWMLEKLGIADYDAVQNIEKLVFTIQDAIREAKIQWKTIDLGRIKQITKLVIVRELNMLDGRKDAQKYAETRMPTISDFEMDIGAESVVKSQAALSQYSGSRASPSPKKHINVGLSQMSSDGKMPPSRSALKPPQPFSPDFHSSKKTAPSFNLGSVGVMSPKEKGDGPTADKLKKLDTAAAGRSASAAPSLKGG